ncbi:hypothetical protein [Sphingomonas xinjiangensis]|uniref:Uncharacterized protein n=1 Tax=Sphingomonas xinjiangensis TaxID=643568 RepID=A0A840YQ80_9SPHN|nr:hypothetical protein [Sphingomonas xinjiangensis]MBB5710901.1 hypothetical protein [Sphingomonas xinjiangensis]
MNPALRSRRIATLAPKGRGARFGARASGNAAPRYDDLAKLPDWLNQPMEKREQVAALAALLRYRRAIDAELSGPRLAQIAAAVGEALFDAACEVPAWREGPQTLPPPDRLIADGRALMVAALPHSLSDRFSGARDDASARAIVVRAQHIAEALS